MRATAILLIFLISGATAVDWTDPTGDHEVTYSAADVDGEGRQPLPAKADDWYPRFDLTGSSIRETEEHVIFEVQVAGLGTGQAEPRNINEIEYRAMFDFRGEARALTIVAMYDWEWAWGRLEHNENGRWLSDAWFMVEPLANGWSLTADKWVIRDSSMVPMREGDSLTDITITASEWQYSWPDGTLYFNPPCLQVDTAAPEVSSWDPRPCGFKVTDSAQGSNIDITLSPRGLNSLFLEAPEPFRMSNGLATTYLFEIFAKNLGDAAQVVEIGAMDVPRDFQVFHPPAVNLPPGGEEMIPVAVSVPFQHAHGSMKFLNVTGLADGHDLIKTTLGIYWPEIPQPAGHHDTLWFHSDGRWEWMNAAKVDPDNNPQDAGVQPWRSRGPLLTSELPDAPVRYVDNYEIHLEPGLWTGLDFDPARSYEARLVFGGMVPGSATVEASLEWYNYETEEQVNIGILTPTPMTVDAQGVAAADVTFAVPDGIDRLEFNGPAGVELRVDVENVATPGPGMASVFSSNPILVKEDSWLKLPLVDYHDAIDSDVLASLSQWALGLPEQATKQVNPGRTASYTFTIENKGDKAGTIDWYVEGDGKEWASITPSSTIVGPGSQASVAVAVKPPETAKEGKTADLLIFGEARDGGRVFGRIVATVNTLEDIPDESQDAALAALSAEKNEARPTPGFMVGLLGVALLVAARSRR